MQTDALEYQSLLYRIQSKNKPQRALLLPSYERIFNIDLTTKKIDAPEFLSVQTDHSAETIYFRCARFFDHMDLSTTTCVVQYINAKGESGIYHVPFFDIVTLMDSDEMIIPWTISGKATAAAGVVKFSIKFYIVDSSSHQYLYALNTLSSESKVLVGMALKDLEDEREYQEVISRVEEALNQIDAKTESFFALYWDEL